MIQSIFILSTTGEVLIERHFRPLSHLPPSQYHNPRAPCSFFWDLCQKASDNASPSFGGGEASKPFTHGDRSAEHDGGLSASFSSAAASTTFGGPPLFPLDGENVSPTIMALGDIPPVIRMGDTGLYIVSCLRGALIFLGTATQESPPLLVIEFLHRVADIFEDYFGSPIDDELVKENFSTVYQLLEEMNDFGYPLTTEPNSLKAMIAPPTVLGKLAQLATGTSSVACALPPGATSSMPWRAGSVKYANNEMYVDVVEEVDAMLDEQGNVVSADVSGSIECVSRLSGVPDLTLTFRDPSLIDDCSFHPCVRYGRYERDHVVSFVPPDGAFNLMRYRVASSGVRAFVPPLSITTQLSFGGGGRDALTAGGGGGGGGGANDARGGGGSGGDNDYLAGFSSASSSRGMDGRVSITVSLRPGHSLLFPSGKGGGAGVSMVVEDVVVTLPFPKVVRTANLTATFGTVLYDEATRIATWTIPKVDGSKKLALSGSMMLSGNQRPEECQPIAVQWKVPMASVSGLAVSGLNVVGENYKPYKGVRSITRSGKFTIRVS